MPLIDYDPNKKTPEPDPTGNSELPYTPATTASKASLDSVEAAILNTPIAVTENSAETDGFEGWDAKVRYPRLAEEMKTKVLGPMPPRVFFEKLMPDNKRFKRSGQLSSKGAFKALPENPATEEEIYKIMIAILQQVSANGRKSRCPGFSFRDTSTRTEYHKQKGSHRPDITVYKTKHLPLVEPKQNKNKPVDPLVSETNMSYAASWFEIKKALGLDFCKDPPNDISPEARDKWEFVLPEASYTTTGSLQYSYAVKGFGQNVSYGIEIFTRQHRTHLYSVSISGCHARLVYWDRAGAVVTESFNLREDEGSYFLCEFLWRFAQMSDMERGYDFTVGPATAEEEKTFREALTKAVEFQRQVTGYELEKALLEHYEPGVVSAMHLPLHDPLSNPPFRFYRVLVSRPTFLSLSLVSKGTRGYWAMDTRTGIIVFMKDTWRIAIGDMEMEGHIVARLIAAGVRNVPGVVDHSEVPKAASTVSAMTADEVKELLEGGEVQSTQSQELLDAEWLCGRKALLKDADNRIVKHTHYRMTSDTVGYSLRKMSGTAELLHMTYDTFQAMRDALTKTGILHGDISLGNIIMVRQQIGDTVQRVGNLVDWESSRPDDEDAPPRPFQHSGSLPFKSANLLNGTLGRRHSMEDDMESLLWIVLYCALLWLGHNVVDIKVLEEILRGLFGRPSLTTSGGKISALSAQGKQMNARERATMRDHSIKFTSRALNKWIFNVMELHSPCPAFHPSYVKAAKKLNGWNPENLDKLWKYIFAKYGEPIHMPRFDRVKRVLPNPAPKAINEGTRPTSEERRAEQLAEKAPVVACPPKRTRAQHKDKSPSRSHSPTPPKRLRGLQPAASTSRYRTRSVTKSASSAGATVDEGSRGRPVTRSQKN